MLTACSLKPSETPWLSPLSRSGEKWLGGTLLYSSLPKRFGINQRKLG